MTVMDLDRQLSLNL